MAHYQKHGLSRTPEYLAWHQMKRRCFDPRCPLYRYYGARGITVCKLLSKSAQDFLAILGQRPSREHSLDRIDNDQGYWCGQCEECRFYQRLVNVRWSTWTQQARNRRNNSLLLINGQRKTLSELAEENGLNPAHVSNRIRAGWTPEQALNLAHRDRRGGFHFGRAKLNSTELRAVRRLLRVKGVTPQRLGDWFSVHSRTIRDIKAGISYKHISGEI